MGGKKSEKTAKLTFDIDPEELAKLEEEKKGEVEELEVDEFFDQPGYSYAITRTFPNDGFVGTLQSPIGYQEIMDHFGGGQYLLLRKKGHLLAGRRAIKIAGDPKPIKGNDDLLESLKRENEELKNRAPANPSPQASLLDNPKIQELLVLRAIGGQSDSLLLKLLGDSGDQKVKLLIEGMKMGRDIAEGKEPEEEGGGIVEKVVSTIASLLDRKSVEMKTVNKIGDRVTATHTKVGSEDVKTNLGEEQMVWDNLIEKVENMILDGIEKKTPPAEISAKIKVLASPVLISMLGGLTPEAMLQVLKDEYVDNPEVSQMLQLQENQVYLTQILEELKK
jgi:hypothetical protein